MPTQIAVRWQILSLLVFVSLVRSMDAVNFSVAAKQIMPEYGLTEVQMGVLYSAFTLGYGAFHVPGGWLGDVVGPRLTLAVAILWWSIFTGLTALAGGLPLVGHLLTPFWAFFLVRFLIGLGEGAAYPTASKTVANWMAADERGLASGLVWSGLGLGYSLAPPVVAWIMVYYGWRLAFYGFAVVGVVLAALWYAYMRDRPEEHRRVSQEELQRIYGDGSPRAQAGLPHRHPPWRALLTDRNVVLLSCAAFCLGYMGYIYQSWFYLYLVNVRGFSVLEGGVFATGPFLAITVLCPLGGLFSDILTRRYGSTRGRRVAAMTGFLLSALCVYLGATAADPYMAVLLLSLGDGFAYSALGSVWGTIMGIAGEHTGAVYGVVGMCGNMGGMLAPTLTPLVAGRYGWEAAIHVAALMTFSGGIIWLAIDAGRKIAVGEQVSAPLPAPLWVRDK
jgi:ACS family glucarate transporter-like MFS transporter